MMIRKVPVSTIMTQSVITLTKEDHLEQAEYLFKMHNIRHIPIVDGTAIIGMISKTDLQRIGYWHDAAESHDLNARVKNDIKVEAVMTKTLTCVSSSTSVKKVAEILVKEPFHALPIVDNNRLIGMVTTTDLLHFLLKQF